MILEVRGSETYTLSVSNALRAIGFAIKIKTEEGNLDWVFNNTPVFFIRDPAKFPHFIHTQKRDPEPSRRPAPLRWVRLVSWRRGVLGLAGTAAV